MILFLDFEASSLAEGSFPLEVAWVDQDGHGASYLIRPAKTWLNPERGSLEWSSASERIHGISLATLLSKGIRHEQVANRAVQAMTMPGMVVCSDAPGFDGSWLSVLLTAAGLGVTVPLVDVREVYGAACRPLLALLPAVGAPGRRQAEQRVRTVAAGIVVRAEEAEARRTRVRHRALSDAQGLWRTWRAIRDEVAQHLVTERAP